MRQTPPPHRDTPRKCSQCDGGVLQCVSVTKAGIGIEKSYECDLCPAKVTIPAEGVVGTTLFVWGIVSAGLAWMFLVHARFPGLFSYLFVFGFTLAGGYFAWRDLYRHLRHPFIAQDMRNDTDTPEGRPKSTGMARFWDLGLVKSPLIAVAGLVVILGLIAFLGYIFGDA